MFRDHKDPEDLLEKQVIMVRWALRDHPVNKVSQELKVSKE